MNYAFTKYRPMDNHVNRSGGDMRGVVRGFSVE